MTATAKARARALLLDQLGAGEVAAWCGVSENAVYQWLRRGTEAEPIPVGQVLPLILGASRAGKRFDVTIVWPPFSELRL